MSKSRDAADQINRVNSSAANATAITIDANENVGIGTSFPSVLLDLESASPIIRLTDSDASGTPECQISGAGGDLIFDADRDNEKASSLMLFKVDGTEAMRISSGNLLLGTTGTNWTTTAGLYAFNQSALNVTRNGAESMNLNRLSSAGDIIKLYKSGSAVGSIGAFGNSGAYIAAPTSGGSALVFNGNAPILYPAKNNSGTIAVADNAIDLGASGVRFKDLYLSGGVYLGGTGAANKLDDYEEGTWTPTFENGTFTYNVQNGTYTKVGNLVTIACNIGWTSRSGSGALIIQTLPFTPINSGNTYRGAGSLGTISGVNKPSNHQMTVGVDAALAKIFLRYFADNSSWVGTNVGDLSASGEIQITVSYHAQ